MGYEPLYRPSELNFLNYLCLVLAYLTKTSGACGIKDLIRTCSLKVFNGKIINYKKIIRLGVAFGFVEVKTGIISLTNLGREFLSLNPKKTFEMNIDQNIFFSNSALFNGFFKSKVRRIFSSFLPNYEEVSFSFNFSVNSIPKDLRFIINYLEFLDVIKIVKTLYIVNPIYVKQVRDIRAIDRKKMSQVELDLILENQRVAGLKAEELIVQWEIDRLTCLGNIAEAERVRRISELEVAAGYDIESFNGETEEIEYTRFIEVKSFQYDDYQFHWSSNEIEIAKILKNKYWIYYIKNYNKNTTDCTNIELILIQNPFKKIFVEENNITKNIQKYIISGFSELA